MTLQHIGSNVRWERCLCLGQRHGCSSFSVSHREIELLHAFAQGHPASTPSMASAARLMNMTLFSWSDMTTPSSTSLSTDSYITGSLSLPWENPEAEAVRENVNMQQVYGPRGNTWYPGKRLAAFWSAAGDSVPGTCSRKNFRQSSLQ